MLFQTKKVSLLINILPAAGHSVNKKIDVPFQAFKYFPHLEQRPVFARFSDYCNYFQGMAAFWAHQV